jgi:hypothetical protein
MTEEYMRRIVLLFVALTGCGTTEPEPHADIPIQVQGTVTSAADGTAIEGASVEVIDSRVLGPSVNAHAEGLTDAVANYALSFSVPRRYVEGDWTIVASCGRFSLGAAWQAESASIQCTDEAQTIDFQLELSGTVTALAAVWGTSSSDVFAVGWDGTILHYDGSGWTEMMSGTDAGLTDV